MQRSHLPVRSPRRTAAGVAFLLAGALACLLWGCGGPGPDADGDPPAASGIVLISLDTLRADHLGLYGHARDTSPFLDGLAERSVVFEHAFAQYPSTLTSHMSMLTGLYPAEHGVYPPAGTLSDDVPLVAELLQAEGWRTAGYTEGGFMRGSFGFRRGFDDFEARDRDGEEQLENTFRRGLRFLRDAGEEPFFLFLHTYAVHAPYDPPARYAGLFWDGDPPADAFAPTPTNLVDADERDLPQSAEAVAWYEALYDAEIRYLDDVLRGFFDELEALGLADSTTVILTSDHGEEFREHGRFNHDQLYQEVLRVPFLVVHPGAQPRRSERVVELVDVTPTLLDLAGIEPGDGFSGSSLAGELTSPSSYPKRLAYAEASGGRRSLYSLQPHDEARERDLLHVLAFPGPRKGVTGRDLELYVTSRDPGEQDDVSTEAGDVLRGLAERLETTRHRARASASQGELDADLRERLRALGYLQ